MRKRSTLIITAVALALVGLVLGAIYVSNLPRTLTIAVGPVGLETHRYVAALAQAEIDGRERIRLKIITTSGAAESAKVLENNGADLAVIRSDYELPINGQTLLVTSRWARKLTFIDLTSKKVVRQIDVGRSPHGVWTLDHAGRQ